MVSRCQSTIIHSIYTYTALIGREIDSIRRRRQKYPTTTSTNRTWAYVATSRCSLDFAPQKLFYVFKPKEKFRLPEILFK